MSTKNEITFYRCETCASVVSPWDIRKAGCSRCGGVRVRPSNLTLVEKMVQVIKHPKIWEWHKHEIVPADQKRP